MRPLVLATATALLVSCGSAGTGTEVGESGGEGVSTRSLEGPAATDRQVLLDLFAPVVHRSARLVPVGQATRSEEPDTAGGIVTVLALAEPVLEPEPLEPPPEIEARRETVTLDGPSRAVEVVAEPAPEPAPDPAPEPAQLLSELLDASGIEGLLACIRAHESSDNYTATNGVYRGAYQFDGPTWASVGGSGDPAEASPEEQDYRAALLYSLRGTQPWPSAPC